MRNNEPPERSPEQNLVTRRGVVKAGLAALTGFGLVRGVERAANNIANNTLDTPQEQPPVPTGHTLFDAYGNQVDTNELLKHGYATAVEYEEQRQKEQDD